MLEIVEISKHRILIDMHSEHQWCNLAPKKSFFLPQKAKTIDMHTEVSYIWSHLLRYLILFTDSSINDYLTYKLIAKL